MRQDVESVENSWNLEYWMKHQEANSTEVEKRRLQEAIHLVRESFKYTTDILTFVVSNFDIGRPPKSLLFKYRFILPLSSSLDPYPLFSRLQSLAFFSYLLVILGALFCESPSLVQDR